MPHTDYVYIGLGSNISPRMEYIKNALEQLSHIIQNIQYSSVYETEAMYVIAQSSFLNMVICGSYEKSPQELLQSCLHIENSAGRVRTQRRGARIIDIDILLFGMLQIDTKTLRIPHPLMHERRFVLIPLLELCPNSIDPVHNISYAQHLSTAEPYEVSRVCSIG